MSEGTSQNQEEEYSALQKLGDRRGAVIPATVTAGTPACAGARSRRPDLARAADQKGEGNYTWPGKPGSRSPTGGGGRVSADGSAPFNNCLA